jgi:7-carboxy-7-deazaguanine synthase
MSPALYPVVETFHSLQGEGAWTGSSAFFIRLGGCDVGCPWCDTKPSWNAQRHPQQSVQDLVAEARSASPAFVVITGGEPLMHNLEPLTTALRQQGLRRIHLETSGAHSFSGDFDWVTLSPKPFKPPLPNLYAQASELKIVIAQPSDFTWAEAQSAQVGATVRRYLQPEWQAAQSPASQSPKFQSQASVMAYILAHPQWQLSLQTHKLLGVR